jgi:hypothetical protein
MKYSTKRVNESLIIFFLSCFEHLFLRILEEYVQILE